jgi:hypothetical protein
LDFVNQAQPLSCLRFRNERKRQLRKLQARVTEAMIAARRAKGIHVLTFLNEIETQAATLLSRESHRFHGHGPLAIFLFG